MSGAYRQLEHNIVFPRSSARVPPANSSAPPGTVFVYNLSAYTIESIDSNGAVIVPQLLPVIPGSSAPFASFTRSGAQFLPVQVNFSTAAGNWEQTLNFGAAPLKEVLTLWCYYNGFVLASAAGGMMQVGYTQA